MTDLLTIVGAIGVIGIPITFWVARRGRKRPLLMSTVDFDVLLRSDDAIHAPDVKILHGDEPLRSISRTYVALWNHDGDTIRKEDIVLADPLRVDMADGCVLLNAKVAYFSRPQCDVAVSVADNSAHVSFTFLDQGDGGIIELLQEGTTQPSIKGTVMGTDLKSKSESDLTPSRIQWMRESTRRQRIRARVGSAPRRRKIMFGILAIYLLVIVGFLMWYFRSYINRDAKLVAFRADNLSTLEGQKQFADMVRDVGLPQNPWPVLLMVGGLLLLMAAYMLFSLLGLRRVPRSILAEEFTE